MLMAVSKQELLSALERFWVLVDALAVTTKDVDDNLVIVGTVVSSTQPQESNVVWIQTQD